VNRELGHAFRRRVEDVAARGRGLRIMEIGSFTGVVSVALQRLGHRVTASDIHFVLEDKALRSFFDAEGVAVCPANLSHSQLPVPDEIFDLIVFNEVMEHLNLNPIPLLREFARVLAPGGKVYCATPNLAAAKNRWLMLRGKSYINPVTDLVHNLTPNTGMSVGLHWREWTRDELVEVFSVAGLKLSSHRFTLVTPNRSKALRRTMVGLMYRFFPSLLPGQVGVFQKG
jgi:SAM-dependent methyltransferase